MANIAELVFQLAKLGQNGDPPFIHHPAGIGQQQFTSIADQQRTPQFLLQVPQHFADGRLRDIQILRRAGKVLLSDYFHKITQRFDVHQRGPWAVFFECSVFLDS